MSAALTVKDLLFLRIIIGVFLRNYVIDSDNNPELQSIQVEVIRLRQKINTLIRLYNNRGRGTNRRGINAQLSIGVYMMVSITL